MNVYEKLFKVQGALKAPKNQYNSFGKYNYRNAEDILEAVKPILKEVNALVLLTDEIKNIGNRYYVECTAKFVDCEPQGSMISFIDVKASAREEEDKKGMDGSQITGSSSSYARKYALNGLFAIDDTKDSDTTNTGEKPKKEALSEIPPVELPFNDVPLSPRAMTLEEALEVQIKTREGLKKMKDLTDAQLEIGLKNWTVEEWKQAAEVILLYKAGQK